MWIALAFLSAALLGLYDTAKKHALRDNAVIPILTLNTLFCALLFVPSIIMSAIGVLPPEHTLYVPAPDLHAFALIIVKSLIVLGSWIFGYYALKSLPLTIAGPINATRPVLTLLGALIIFGESLNHWQWAGVLVGILSFWMMSRSGRSEGIRFTHNRWIAFLIIAAILGALSGLYDKYLMRPAADSGAGLDPRTVQGWYNICQACMMAIVLALIWWPRRKAGYTSPMQWRWSIVLISLFLTAADAAYFHALTHSDAMIAVVSMVRRSSVVVSFLCGALLFGEKNLRSKAIDLLLVLLSMACLLIGTL